ncbi:MAG: D-Ala-D-Ala carboxypeptidase family metallohydrolase [Smithella sp.]|jgi:uncharacterized protein YcbK (DUF882 family)
MNWSEYKHFKCKEFDSPDAPGSGAMMNPKLIQDLILMRAYIGRPIRITSGYRTKEHNAKVGGSATSAHLDGDAADIACSGSIDRYDLLKAALAAGIQRAGLGKNFIHIDVSDRLPQDVIWLY